MKIQQINKLKKKAIKEAQREVDKIFSKYSKLIVDEITNQIPKGQKLSSGNGMCSLQDEMDNELKSGCAWNNNKRHTSKLSSIAELQYPTDGKELYGYFEIPHIIYGKLD